MVFKFRGIPREWKEILVALISKNPDALAFGHFRLINMCTILYKVCARILVSR